MSETTPVQTEPQSTSATSTQTQGIATLDERAYHELVQQLKEEAVPEKTETPKEEPKAEVAEEPKVEQAEAAPEEPKADAPAEEAQPVKPQEDEVDEINGRLPERVRVGSWNEVERKALQIRARNPDLTLEQALEMVKKGSEEAPVANPDSLLNQIEEAVKGKAQALKALEFDKAAEAELQIIKLQRDMRQAEAQARVKEAREVEARQIASEEAKARSVKYYPDAAKSESALVQKMNEIYEDLRATGNPLVQDPQMPWKLTQMAANELGIAPKVNGVVKAKQAVAAPSSSVAKPRTPPIASGNARTTPQPQPTAAELAAKIEDLDQLMALASKL